MKRQREVAQRLKDGKQTIEASELALLALRPRTRQDYMRDIAQLCTWCGVEGVDAIEEQPFFEIAITLADLGYSASRLEKFRCALAHYQCDQLPPQDQFTQTKGFRKRFSGALSLCKAAVCRGGITEEKLAILVNDAPNTMKLGLLLGYKALLRHSELVNLRVCDVAISGKDAVVTVIGPKGCKEKDGKAAQVFVTRCPGVGRGIKPWIANREGSEILCTNWSRDAANEYIAQVAKKQNWDTKRIWSFHSLRHGHAMDMA
ncbi:MAG: hypothetical protein COA68_12340, partial [Oceanobacter sp.]